MKVDKLTVKKKFAYFSNDNESKQKKQKKQAKNKLQKAFFLVTDQYLFV